MTYSTDALINAIFFGVKNDLMDMMINNFIMICPDEEKGGK